MSIKQLYCYFFYTFYRLWFNIDKAFRATGVFQTSSKAFISMFVIEIWLLFPVGIYLGRLFNIHLKTPLFSFPILAPFVILFILKWFIFERKDQWKNYVNEFNKWPKKKNKIGFLIVGIIILFVILNMIYATNLNLQPRGLKW